MIFRFLLIFLVAVPWHAATADSPASARQCEACHGEGGVSERGDVPTIAGQSAAFIESALGQFRVMGRPCESVADPRQTADRPSTTMCRIAADLTDEEVRSLAGHFAGLEFVPARQDFDPDLAVEGANIHGLYCESCHPGGGSEAGYANRLAGQWTPYLAKTIAQIQNGELIVPHIMERKLSDFSEAEIAALLSFWASRQD